MCWRSVVRFDDRDCGDRNFSMCQMAFEAYVLNQHMAAACGV